MKELKLNNVNFDFKRFESESNRKELKSSVNNLVLVPLDDESESTILKLKSKSLMNDSISIPLNDESKSMILELKPTVSKP